MIHSLCVSDSRTQNWTSRQSFYFFAALCTRFTLITEFIMCVYADILQFWRSTQRAVIALRQRWNVWTRTFMSCPSSPPMWLGCKYIKLEANLLLICSWWWGLQISHQWGRALKHWIIKLNEKKSSFVLNSSQKKEEWCALPKGRVLFCLVVSVVFSTWAIVVLLILVLWSFEDIEI